MGKLSIFGWTVGILLAYYLIYMVIGLCMMPIAVWKQAILCDS
jgi:hypothetical protein